LVGVLAVWKVVTGHQSTVNAIANNQDPATTGTDPQAVDSGAKPPAAQVQINRRWLPEQTLVLVDLRPSGLASQPRSLKSLALLGGWWQPASGALLNADKLSPEKIRRLTWATSDLADGSAHCTIAIELEDGIKASMLLPPGESVALAPN